MLRHRAGRHLQLHCVAVLQLFLHLRGQWHLLGPEIPRPVIVSLVDLLHAMIIQLRRAEALPAIDGDVHAGHAVSAAAQGDAAHLEALGQDLRQLRTAQSLVQFRDDHTAVHWHLHDPEDRIVLLRFPSASSLHRSTCQGNLGQIIFEVHIRRVDHLIRVSVHMTFMQVIHQFHLRQPLAVPHPSEARHQHPHREAVVRRQRLTVHGHGQDHITEGINGFLQGDRNTKVGTRFICIVPSQT
mmetsp:Transcript_16518/g.27976  ORF Transcript_16518/g.27976 Transcript_16518/m.27976 type:complete len:241 (-) Transcript_16518:1043-1765(-)